LPQKANELERPTGLEGVVIPLKPKKAGNMHLRTGDNVEIVITDPQDNKPLATISISVEEADKLLDCLLDQVMAIREKRAKLLS
jgi:hypothetical protein